MSDVRWFGHPGHFILAPKCQWHLHAHVGRYCVTGVGELYRDGTMETISGDEGLYEIMVFDRLNRQSRWTEIKSYRGATRKAGVAQFMKALRWTKERVLNDSLKGGGL